MQQYLRKKIKKIIRENLWTAMEKASNIHARENPHAATELLEQQQENLNALTEKTFNEIGDLLPEVNDE